MKRIISFAMVLLLLCSFLSISASEKDEVIDVTYIPITGSRFVVDTLNGVSAYYSTSSTYYCNEYVIRYYKTVHGVSVSTTSSGPQSKSAGYWFEKTTQPKIGDIIFSPASLRGKSYNHWGIVKDVSGGVVTIIEQNYGYNGKAAFERQIPTDSAYNIFYTLKSQASQVQAPQENLPSSWAKATVEKAISYGITGAGDYQKEVTRAELCAMAVQVMGIIAPDAPQVRTAPSFTDTQDEYVSMAYQLGIINGVSDTSFNPDGKVSRESAAAVLDRMAQAAGIYSSGASVVASFAEDYDDVSQWAQASVDAMAELGILQGTGGSITPKARLTNEQALVLFTRLIDLANAG